MNANISIDVYENTVLKLILKPVFCKFFNFFFQKTTVTRTLLTRMALTVQNIKKKSGVCLPEVMARIGIARIALIATWEVLLKTMQLMVKLL